MVSQRSKSGCWTCRLRRKKCPEDGVPCSNCTARAVVCHGYGPRPAWKDRGEREQEEVDRLQLRRRSHQARWRAPPAPQQHPELPSASAEERRQDAPEAQQQQQQQQQEEATANHLCLSPSLALVASSPVAMAELRPSSPRKQGEEEDEEDEEEDGEAQPLRPAHAVGFVGGRRPGGPFRLDNNTTAPVRLRRNYAEQPGRGRQRFQTGGGGRLPGGGAAAPSLCPLVDDDTRQRAAGARDGADDAVPRGGLWQAPSMRAVVVHGGQGLAALAASSLADLLLHGAEHECLLGVSQDAAARRQAHRSLGENLNATQTYLDAASDALAKLSEDLVYIGELSPNKSITSYIPMSGMERKTVEFFICTLIRIHTLHCSSYQAAPAAASVYHRMLSPAMLGDAFFHVAGFRSWVLVTLMDAVDAAVWKQEQEARQRLSMRDLVGKAEAILSTIEDQIRREEDVPTLMYAYGVIIYIHTLTSGHRPAVPEIHAALEKAVPLWQGCSFHRQGLKSVAWAFCVSASLATGHHRRAFSSVLAEAATSDESWTAATRLKALSEECWKISDTGGADCDWRAIMQSLKPSMQTMFV
ncbi:Zn(2)-C6 fungal-type DNA-binding domain protein [Cordyceps fumosorosea ARSEF 2679]|uniref:Zn(2)-C6 fungal-type DNA-binding domain protein n=1 Tax=Cordyceps fumosorosea (strain ARSEF 2679) TaxID=1081104 RepID=A0A162JR57_CORFA|nr:Zn(2)-C6 fungal-type DNA-binding domain protein [Cordyceps fumosorosea ARSEF 2679]OAA72582.1 Zn(2)-C6 fungal-type DNA-binding domain protein [Cordyceps fumosorosea ARSEF 2679]